MQIGERGCISDGHKADVTREQPIHSGVIACSFGLRSSMQLRASGVRKQERSSDMEVKGLGNAGGRYGNKVSSVGPSRGGHKLLQLNMPPCTAKEVSPSIANFVVFGLARSLTAGMHMVGARLQEVVAGGLMTATLVAAASSGRGQRQLHGCVARARRREPLWRRCGP